MEAVCTKRGQLSSPTKKKTSERFRLRKMDDHRQPVGSVRFPPPRHCRNRCVAVWAVDDILLALQVHGASKEPGTCQDPRRVFRPRPVLLVRPRRRAADPRGPSGSTIYKAQSKVGLPEVKGITTRRMLRRPTRWTFLLNCCKGVQMWCCKGVNVTPCRVTFKGAMALDQLLARGCKGYPSDFRVVRRAQRTREKTQSRLVENAMGDLPLPTFALNPKKSFFSG